MSIYDFDDCDEMTLCALATLAEVRRLIAQDPPSATDPVGDALAIIDGYAQSIVDDYEED